MNERNRIHGTEYEHIGGLGRLARMAEMDEFTAPLPQKDCVSGLIVSHDKLLKDAIETRELAGQTGDLETQDLMIKRIAGHQKTIWMLKS